MEDFPAEVMHKFNLIIKKIKNQIEAYDDYIPVVCFKDMEDFDNCISCEILYHKPEIIIDIEGHFPVYLEIGKKYDLIYMQN